MSVSERRLHAEARVGTCLRGKWHLERLLGIGGSSAVFAARHRNGARVAIKMLHRELALDPRIRARFLCEGLTANRVEHPAVIRVLDDEDSEEPFLVLELVEGQTLAEITSRRPLGRGELLDVAEQLLHALTVAHGLGIVHRDIKPQNLLLDGRKTLRILDFGIARAVDDVALRALSSGAAEEWGTLEYLAPEVLSGTSRITEAVDIYAVGATLFRLASMQYVHEGAHPGERAERIMSTPARSLAAATDAFDPAVVHLVDRATMHRVSDRWQSAEEMLERVERLLHGRIHRRLMSTDPPPPADEVSSDPERATLTYPQESAVSSLSGEFPTRVAV